MISFIAAHWWTWPLIYLGVGALLSGLFYETCDSLATWLAWVFLWPFIILCIIGIALRDMW